MTRIRRLAVVLACIIAAPVLAVAPAAAGELAQGGDDNAAVAVNTEDGASVFRLAFSIRKVNNGVVDQTNSAYALASCTDCQTVALAFQVVLVRGDADVVVPENTAVAFNDQCVECLTYASATQIVLGVDGPTRFTAEGRQRLAVLYQSLRDLEDQVATLSASELHAAVTAAKTELIAILGTELVPAGRPADEDDDADETTTTTSTTTGEGESTTTTEPEASTTSTTVTTTTSTTSTTVESSTTSTTTP
jgi:putative peptide zinc metalloprotease protein